MNLKNKYYLLLLILLPVFTLCFLKAAVCSAGALDGKKIVMIIAHENYRDEELEVPLQMFKKAGVDVAIASTALTPATGMLGGTVTPDMLYSDITVSDYDAIVFVGGSGATVYWNDSAAQEIAKKAIEDRKILAAICFGPVTLANAGVLEGKKATVSSSEGGKLKAMGVYYTGAGVQVDGDIVTANGPQNAGGFAEAIINLL